MSEPFADLRQEIMSAELDSMPDSDGNLDWAGMYAKDVKSLSAENTALREQQWIVWEGDESEGRWRCLMCGEIKEGENDTGPEGVEHLWNCGNAGSTVWAFLMIDDLRKRVETYERMNDAVRGALGKAIPGFEGSGAGAVESIDALSQRSERLERERDLYGQLATFKDAKAISLARTPDYGLAIYTLRDLPLTKEFELDDLAWVHHKEGNTSKGDWEYFRDLWLANWRDELAAVQEKAGCDPYQEKGKEPWERENTQEESEA